MRCYGYVTCIQVEPTEEEVTPAGSEVTYMLNTGLTEHSHSADGSVRFYTDFRKVNALTKANSFLFTRIENCMDQVGHPKYVSKFDLLKGYWQVPLTE